MTRSVSTAAQLEGVVGAQVPSLVSEVVARRPLLASALERLHGACLRMSVSASAEAIAALLLACEVDAKVLERIANGDERPVRRSPTRGEVLSGLDSEVDEALAVEAMELLEVRRLIVTRTTRSPWFAAEVTLVDELRAFCFGSNAGEQSTTFPLSSPRMLEEVERIKDLLDRFDRREFIIVLRGRRGSGRDSALLDLLSGCSSTGLRRSTRDLRDPVLSLEPELSGAVAIWDARGSEPTPDDQELAQTWLARSPTFAAAVIDKHHDPPEVPGRRSLFLDTDPRSREERQEIWRHALSHAGVAAEAVTAVSNALATRGRAGGGLAARALKRIPKIPDDAAELLVAVEESLGELTLPSSRRGVIVTEPEVPWARLIVSPGVSLQLETLIALIHAAGAMPARDRVGVKALFSGPPGTGKTLAALALATRLALPVYRIDLASVVSKWVGETEKNLRHALEGAEAAGAVLVFDEGDALFSKRGDVERGSDRYANLEVSYLLQAIEVHDGIIVVTTNLKQNFDSAFQRRFDVSIDFPRPDAQERGRLWEQEIRDGRHENLSGSFIGEISRADLAGGNIAAAARLAIALARARGSARVSRADVCAAIASELHKVGSTVQAGQWNALAKTTRGDDE